MEADAVFAYHTYRVKSARKVQLTTQSRSEIGCRASITHWVINAGSNPVGTISKRYQAIYIACVLHYQTHHNADQWRTYYNCVASISLQALLLMDQIYA